jgi:hypothetical protein
MREKTFALGHSERNEESTLACDEIPRYARNDSIFSYRHAVSMSFLSHFYLEMLMDSAWLLFKISSLRASRSNLLE